MSASADRSQKLLGGIVVLDVSRGSMGAAIASLELLRYGAEVIKVELPPFGDHMREEPPLIRGVGHFHLHLNRGKSSIALDLKHTEGRAVFDDLVRMSNVVITATVRSTLERLRLDYQSLRDLNPKVVHCAVSGFGLSGPYAELPAHGLSADPAAAVVGPEIGKDGDWASPYIVVGPRAAGLHAASGILAALVSVGRGGDGASLEISQYDAALQWNFREITMQTNGAGHHWRYEEYGHRYGTYPTKDGLWLIFAAVEDKLWRDFCEKADALDLLELDPADDSAGAEAIHFPSNAQVVARLEEVFRSRTQAEWVTWAASEHVPLAPVVAARDLPDDPQVRATGALVEGGHPDGGSVVDVAHPVVLGGSRGPVYPAAPRMGEHTVQVMQRLGRSLDAISELQASGAIGPYVRGLIVPS